MASSELMGGTIAYTHSFSEAQMEALEALMDTFIPSISPPPALDDRIAEIYYQLTASKAGIPTYAAGLIEKKLNPDSLRLARVVLWLLTTRMGTYLLCGRKSLCAKPPFFRSFTEIPVTERERLLVTAWSHSPYVFFRVVFDAFKIFAAYSFFSKVDGYGHNPAWKAIGYCGPDPVATEHRKTAQKAARRPLEGRVFDASASKEGLALQLKEAGFEVLKDVEYMASLWKQGKSSLEKGKSAIGVRCDAVVVGSGSGGGVAAGVLAKAGYKVLILEKGKYYARDDLSLLEGPTFDKMYEGGGILPTAECNMLLLAGATVGGGSAVNWSASFKTPPHVLEEWAHDKAIPLFSEGGRYEAAMDAVLSRLSVQPDPGEENWQNRILWKGCEKLGYHVDHAPRNCVPDHACGWCGFGCWNGKKQATSETWLVDATDNGAAIVTSISAEAVLYKKSTQGKKHEAVGVVASITNEDKLLFVESRITIVSCGSLNTPILLKRSHLENTQIGKHLHLHPVQMMWGYFPADGASDYEVAYEGGIITSLSREFANCQRGGHGCILQCPSLHPGVCSVLVPWLSGDDFKERMQRFSRTVHVFALARDRGTGSVGWGKNGRIINYPLHPLDHESLVDGGEAALRVLIAAGASEVGTYNRFGDRLCITKKTTTAQVEEFLRCVRARGIEQLGAPLCSAHQMGSCRMGIDPTSSVVDPNGETWDVAHLFVADASVFPTAIGVNPMITTQAIAYCVAHAALQNLK